MDNKEIKEVNFIMKITEPFLGMLTWPITMIEYMQKHILPHNWIFKTWIGRLFYTLIFIPAAVILYPLFGLLYMLVPILFLIFGIVSLILSSPFMLYLYIKYG